MERAAARVRSRTSCSCSLDVWTEILLRLPVEKLIQLKSVCKPWRELIEDTYFTEAHRDLHRPRGAGVLIEKLTSSGPATKHRLYYLSSESDGYNDDVKLREIRLPEDGMNWTLAPGESWTNWMLRDSYDGLLLISRYDDDRLILYNSITRSMKRLPAYWIHCGGPDWDWKIMHDASTNRYTVFGYYLDKYRHIGGVPTRRPRFLMLELDKGNEIDSNSLWKELPLPPVQKLSVPFTRSAARSNGRLYWLILGPIDPHKEPREINIHLLSFDLAKKNFEVRACSFGAPPPHFYHEVFVSNGTFYYTRTLCGEIELWVLKNLDTRPTWFKHHVIKNDPDSATSSSVMHKLIWSCFLGAKLIMILDTENKITMYDTSSKKFKSIVVDEDQKGIGGCLGFGWKYFPDHVNSLISLN